MAPEDAARPSEAAMADYGRRERGAMIVQRRGKLKLTQAALAALAGVSVVCLRRLEFGFVVSRSASARNVLAALRMAESANPVLLEVFQGQITDGARGRQLHPLIRDLVQSAVDKLARKAGPHGA